MEEDDDDDDDFLVTIARQTFHLYPVIHTRNFQI